MWKNFKSLVARQCWMLASTLSFVVQNHTNMVSCYFLEWKEHPWVIFCLVCKSCIIIQNDHHSCILIILCKVLWWFSRIKIFFFFCSSYKDERAIVLMKISLYILFFRSSYKDERAQCVFSTPNTPASSSFSFCYIIVYFI